MSNRQQMIEHLELHTAEVLALEGKLEALQSQPETLRLVERRIREHIASKIERIKGLKQAIETFS